MRRGVRKGRIPRGARNDRMRRGAQKGGIPRCARNDKDGARDDRGWGREVTADCHPERRRSRREESWVQVNGKTPRGARKGRIPRYARNDKMRRGAQKGGIPRYARNDKMRRGVRSDCGWGV